MGVFSENAIIGASAAGGYDIDQSLRIEDADGYLTRTFGSAGNRKTWTYSVWCKKAQLDNDLYLFASDYSDSSNFLLTKLSSSSKNYGLEFQWRIAEATTRTLLTSQVFRDVGAWYHIVLVCDTTQASASDRLKVYVNGEQVTNFATDNRSNISQNVDTAINRATGHSIAEWAGTAQGGGYFAEVNFIDGQALTPASFGETNEDTSQWVPIKYAESYPGNSFYLKFQDSSSLGDDSSGNTNDFTATNLAATDQVLDSPTNNFATLNPLVLPRASGSFTYSEGNLKVSMGGTGDADCPSTMGASSGKWYAEAYILTGDQSTNTPFVGLVSSKFLDNETIASSSNSCVYYYTGYTRTNGTLSGSAEFATYNAGDVIGIAFNANDNEVTFYKNNSSQGTKSLTSDEYVFISGKSGGTPVLVWNFGQDSSFANNKTSGAAGSDFYYTPPTGFKALNTENLSDPSIALPGEHFEAVVYVGDGNSTQEVTTNFQPDLIWNKNRTTGYHHRLFDRVRGLDKSVYPNRTEAEDAFQDYGYPTTTSSTSVTVGQGDDSGNLINVNGSNYVLWNWKAGGTAVSNTDGTITSSVSANTDAGFSIATYTGSGSYTSGTVGHGLSQAPDAVFIKKRNSNGADGVRGWRVWHKDLTDAYFLTLNGTNAQFLDRSFGESGNATYPYVAPTSSVIQLGGTQTGAYQEVNYSGDDYVMYCFHEVEGYSKVGSYTGNGSLDGAFFYTGFRPAWILFKSTASVQSWRMVDSERSPYNTTDAYLKASGSDVESSGMNTDFVSNGVKLRTTSGGVNNSETYVYLAFAESPFKTANAR